MQSSERRWAYFYDFHLKPFPEDSPAFELEDVLNKMGVDPLERQKMK